MEALVRDSDVLVVAPVFFATGNLELLRVARRAVAQGRPVVFLDADSIDRRDLTGDEAVSLVKESLADGALSVSSVGEAVERSRGWRSSRPDTRRREGATYPDSRHQEAE